MAFVRLFMFCRLTMGGGSCHMSTAGLSELIPVSSYITSSMTVISV